MATFGGLLGLGKRTLRYRSLETARLIQAYLAFQPAPLRPDGDLVRCDEIGLSFDPKVEPFMVEGLQFIFPIVKTGAGHFERNEEGRYEFRSGSVRIVPETAQELFILDEVFRAGVYDLDDARDWLVWDVGMNVGIASAFFAGIKGWDVVGYEPFPEPFEIARRNVERSRLTNRVELRQEGISDREQALRLAYNSHSRGSNGLYGNNALDKAGEDVETEARFVDAAQALESLVERAGGRPILAKIDCEGAEHGIVRRLRETGLLARLDAVFMEYHLLVPDQSYGSLVRDLTETGFAVHGQAHPTDHVGMIWALRR